ncbi:MAG: tetratricopeptide repeat protein [Xenococcus sp. (in: cyanobacteria)]
MLELLSSLFPLQRHEEVIASYDKALELNPDDDQAWYNRGSVFEEFTPY